MRRISRGWFEKKPRLIAVSLILGSVAWSMVAFSVNSITSRTIEGVKVEMPSAGASFQALGLDVIDSGQEYTCSVTVTGDRSVIGALDAESFTVTPDFTPVTAAGTYTLTLEATKNNQLLDYSIRSVEPYGLILTFGEVETRKFAVTPSATGVSVADGYVLQNIICSPQYVTISGEADQLDEIARVVAEVAVNRTLSESVTVEAAIRLYNDEGRVLSTDGFRTDASAVELTIPVYREGTVPLKVAFTNVPEGFDLSLIRYALSPSTLRVAAGEAAIASVTEKVVGYLDMADLKPGVVYSFPVQLSSGFVNLDNVESVTMSVDFTGFSERKISVSDIRVENVPAGYSVKVVTKSIKNVNVVGLEEQVDSLLPASVAAVIDFSALTLNTGSSTVPVSFRIPSANGLWVSGNYTCVIEVTSGG
jgi:YbbR domain-containing protein